MEIKLVDNPFECAICNKIHSNLRGLSQHVKKHKHTSKSYTIEILLHNNIPFCKCGCGKEILVQNFKYDEFRSGHNPDCLWQKRLNKNSDEYKNITLKISNSVKEYQKDNPVIISDRQKKQRSDYMKNIMSDPIEKEKRLSKMIETKRKQSESGLLSERHYVNKLPEDLLRELYAKISAKAQTTKKEKEQLGTTYESWNKGLTKETDDRLLKISGENNYRFNSNKVIYYNKTFKNKKFRKLILDSQNGTCFNCKKDDGRTLCLHHIDENKHNDKFENLIFVCRACHMKIHSCKMFADIFLSEAMNFKNQY